MSWRRSVRRTFVVAAGAIALAGITLGALIYARRERVVEWARVELEHRLARSLGGEVRVGRIDLDPLRLRVEMRDVDLQLPAGDAPPLIATVERATIRLAWRGLLGLPAGRIHFRDVEILRPVLAVGSGFLESRASRARDEAPIALLMDRLEVGEGTIVFDDHSIPLALQASEVAIVARWDGIRGGIAGEARFSLEVAHEAFAEPLPVAVRSAFRWTGGRLDVSDLGATASGLDVTLTGHATFDGKAGELIGEGRVSSDLRVFRSALRRDFPEMEGTVSGPIRLERTHGRLHLAGRLTADRGRFGPLTARSLVANAEFREGLLHLRGLHSEAYGGNVEGSVEVRFAAPIRFGAALRGRGLDVAALLRLVGSRLPLAGRTDLTLDLRGESGRRSTWNGSGSLEVTPLAGVPGRVGAGGSVDFSLVEGRLRADSRSVDIADAALRMGLVLDLSATPERGSLVLDGETRSAASTREGLLTILSALGIEPPAILREALSGAGQVEARLELGSRVSVDVGLDLRDGRWLDTTFREARLDLGVRDGRVDVRELNVDSDGGKIEGAGTLRLSPFVVEQLDARAIGLDLEPVLGRLAPEVPLTGRLSGTVAWRTGLQGTQGEGTVRVDGGTLLGEPVNRLDASVEVRGTRVRLHDLSVAGPAGDASGEVTFDVSTEDLAISVARSSISLARVGRVGSHELPLVGEVRLWGELRRNGAGLSGRLLLECPAWGVGGEPLGDAAGSLGFSSGGITLDLGPSDGASWHARGTVGVSDERPVRIDVTLDKAYFPIPVGPKSGEAWTILSGTARIRGDLAHPEGITVDGNVDRAQIQLGAVSAQTIAPVPLRLEGGIGHVGPLRIQSRNSDAEATLAYELERGGIVARCSGRLDLASIAALWPGLRATGTAQVDLEIGGTVSAPLWRGVLDVSGARVRSDALPAPLEKVNASIVVENGEARIRSFTALLGGGEVSVAGAVSLSGMRPGPFEFQATLSNVRLDYPSGFRGSYEGQLVAQGEGDSMLLSGRLAVLRGVYSNEFADILSSRPGAEREWASGLPTVFLDVDIQASEGIWIQNEVARIEAAADLHLGGDLGRPELTGRIWALEGGTVRLRDVDYRIVSASLDFTDLNRINPYVEVQAETRVREYDIALRVGGTADRFEYDLTSNPTLSTQEVIALLTTGITQEENQAAKAGGAGGGIGTDVAADYVAGALTGPIERGLRRALSLERVRIDPLLVQEQADPTARITLGKRVSRRLLLVYSTELGSTETQIYRAEWEATRKLRFAAQRDETGGVGGEIGYSTLLGRANASAARSVAAVGAAGGVIGSEPRNRVAGVRIEGALQEDLPALLSRVPLRTGEPFRRSKLFEGEEAIREFYVRSGRIEAQVDGDAIPLSGRPEEVEVAYRVRAGPLVEVRVLGLGRTDRRRIGRRIRAFCLEASFTDDVYGEAAQRIRRDLQEEGFYTAQVFPSIEKAGDQLRADFSVDRGPSVAVDSVRIAGATSLSEDRIRGVLETRQSGALAARLLRPAILERDRAAIERLYRDEGFLRVKVASPQIALRPDGGAAELTFRIDEGNRLAVGLIETAGAPPFSVAQIVEWSALRPGDQFSYRVLAEAESRVRSGLDERGYPEARVSSRVELGAANADVRLDVAPGARKQVGAVLIDGNHATQDKVIHRELRLAPGDLISREKLIASQERLYRLGVFRSVRLDYAPMESETERQVLRVRVDEALPLRLGVGAGYDNEAGARGNVALTWNNVGGYNRTVSFQGALSGLYERLQLVVREPRFFNRMLPALLSLYWERREQVGYTEDRRATAFRLEKKYRSDLVGFLRYNFQKVDLSQIEDELAVQEAKLENVRLGDVGYTLSYDRRDDPFLPKSGGYARGEVRWFDEPFLSDESFFKTFLQAGVSRTSPRWGTLASAVRVGVSLPFRDTTRVPLPERFFAGGDSTLRGFGRDQVGPKTSDGVPEGGEAIFLFNEEWRFPIWRSLKGVVFYDAGNVWSTAGDLDPTDSRHVGGAGLRFETPIGPIRFEYGRKLDREPNEPKGEFNVSIGTAF